MLVSSLKGTLFVQTPKLTPFHQNTFRKTGEHQVAPIEQTEVNLCLY